MAAWPANTKRRPMSRKTTPRTPGERRIPPATPRETAYPQAGRPPQIPRNGSSRARITTRAKVAASKKGFNSMDNRATTLDKFGHDFFLGKDGTGFLSKKQKFSPFRPGQVGTTIVQNHRYLVEFHLADSNNSHHPWTENECQRTFSRLRGKLLQLAKR